MDAFGKWASTYDWFGKLKPNPTTDSLALSFMNCLTETIHRIFPQKKVTRHQNDKPWITPTIKQLIADRQKVFHCQNIPAWKSLKYKVQQEIKSRKTTYYKTEVKHLKKDDSRRWCLLFIGVYNFPPIKSKHQLIIIFLSNCRHRVKLGDIISD